MILRRLTIASGVFDLLSAFSPRTQLGGQKSSFKEKAELLVPFSPGGGTWPFSIALFFFSRAKLLPVTRRSGWQALCFFSLRGGLRGWECFGSFSSAVSDVNSFHRPPGIRWKRGRARSSLSSLPSRQFLENPFLFGGSFRDPDSVSLNVTVRLFPQLLFMALLIGYFRY